MIDTKQKKPISFIEANTEPTTLEELKTHFIPRFAGDNEPLIAQTKFLEILKEEALSVFNIEIVGEEYRKSHLINGCIPSAMHKPAKELLEHEKVTRYDRVGGALILNKKYEDDGMKLEFVCGGIKAYNLDNLGSKSNSRQKFKIFVGTQNKVCLNMQVFGKGYSGDIEVHTEEELREQIRRRFLSYDYEHDLRIIRALKAIKITPIQVRNFIGNCRFKHAAPDRLLKEKGMSKFPLNDSQLLQFAKDYWTDANFKCDRDGNLDGWKFYNLLTQANKSSYIDEFADRSAGCGLIAEKLVEGNFDILN